MICHGMASGREISDRMIDLAKHVCSQNSDWEKYKHPPTIISSICEVMCDIKQICQERKKNE
jgi:hypothetical protein